MACRMHLNGAMVAKHFTDLVAWQLSVELRDLVHDVTDRPMVKADRDFYSDLRDAAASVPNNVAEGHARFSPAENRRFLSFARASLNEVQNRLLEGKRRRFWSEKEFDRAWTLSRRAGAAIAGLMRYLATDRAKRNAAAIQERIRNEEL